MALPPKPKIGPLVRRSLLAAALGTAVIAPAACGDDGADDGIIAPQVPPQVQPPQVQPPQVQPPQVQPPQAVPPPDAGGPDASDASSGTRDPQDDPQGW